jgi:hypothetical protein
MAQQLQRLSRVAVLSRLGAVSMTRFWCVPYLLPLYQPLYALTCPPPLTHVMPLQAHAGPGVPPTHLHISCPRSSQQGSPGGSS